MKKMICLMVVTLAACAVRSQGACPDLDQIERGIRASDEAVAAAQARLKDRVRLTDYRSLVRADAHARGREGRQQDARGDGRRDERPMREEGH